MSEQEKNSHLFDIKQKRLSRRRWSLDMETKFNRESGVRLRSSSCDFSFSPPQAALASDDGGEKKKKKLD